MQKWKFRKLCVNINKVRRKRERPNGRNYKARKAKLGDFGLRIKNYLGKIMFPTQNRAFLLVAIELNQIQSLQVKIKHMQVQSMKTGTKKRYSGQNIKGSCSQVVPRRA